MKFLSRFPRLRRFRANTQPRTTPSIRPQLELLEERSLLNAAPTTAALQAGYGQLPLAFTVNEGQAAAPINYVAQGSGYNIALSAQQAQVSLGQGAASTTLNLQLAGSNASAQAIVQNELITKTNYLTGSDSSKWLTNVANYGQVEYQNVYQGVDAVYSGNEGQLETTFLVHPGANTNSIQMQIQGAQGLSLDAQGNLVIHTSGGDVTEQAPIAYQDINGVRQSVSSRYVLESNNTVGFQVGAYDNSQTLAIDPTLSYSSYLPGPGVGITVDSSGDAYIAGHITGNNNGRIGNGALVDKLNASGSALIYQTILSTSGGCNSISVDASGDVYVTGFAGTDLATTSNALQPNGPSNGIEAFFSVLNPSGSGLLYSTWIPGVATGKSFFGGFMVGPELAIAPASDGPLDNVSLTGQGMAGFLTTASAYQPNYAGGSNGSDAFLAQIDPNQSGMASLLYGSFLGAGEDGGTGIAVDGSGNAYLVGRTYSTNFPTTIGAFQQRYGGSLDVFVAKFNPSLSGSASLVYSTYLGGSGDEGYSPWDFPTGSLNSDQQPGPAIAVDSAGNAYVAGITTSTNFPTTAGAFQTHYGGNSGSYFGDAFVTKLNSTGTALVYSTYLGGSGQDGATSIAIDAAGDAYVAGMTRSTNFPTVNPIQSHKSSDPKKGFPNADTFVSTLNPSGSALLFSTYLGGSGGDDYAYGLALDSANNVYVTGQTYSSSFPTTSGAYQTTLGGGFVYKIDPPVENLASPSVTEPNLDPSNEPATGNAINPQGQEMTGQAVPSQTDSLFTLVGNNPTVNAIPSALLSLVSDWKSLESALMERFDALLSLAFGGSAQNAVVDGWLRDLFLASLSTSNQT